MAKKRSSKPKKKKPVYPRINNPGPKPDVAEECVEYAKEISEYICQAEQYLKKHPPAAEWLRKASESSPGMNMQTEVHHLFGRGVVAERHWFCSLIQLGKLTHTYAHDVSKFQVEACSLFAKMGHYKRHLELVEVGIRDAETDPSRLLWNTVAMDKACQNISIRGRIEGVLIPSDDIKGTIFEKMLRTLLRHMEEIR